MGTKVFTLLALLSPALPFATAVEVCAPVREGLVGWWSAEANAADNLGEHDGTPAGVVFVPGVRGQAFQFDGAGSRVNVPDGSAFELTNSLTIEGWLKINTFLGAQIFFRGDDRPGLDPYYLSAEPGDRVAFVIMNDANQYEVLYAPVPGNEWIHVAAVLDGVAGTMTIYVNGTLSAQTNTQVRPFAKLEPLADPGIGIGNHGGTSHNFPFNGQIDEIALFSRPLSQSEVMSIYHAGAAGKCSLADICTVQSLIDRLNNSALPARRKRPLLATLEAAVALLDGGHPQNVSNLLRAFQHKVAAQVAPHDPALADSLIHCADQVIQSL